MLVLDFKANIRIMKDYGEVEFTTAKYQTRSPVDESSQFPVKDYLEYLRDYKMSLLENKLPRNCYNAYWDIIYYNYPQSEIKDAPVSNDMIERLLKTDFNSFKINRAGMKGDLCDSFIIENTFKNGEDKSIVANDTSRYEYTINGFNVGNNVIVNSMESVFIDGLLSNRLIGNFFVPRWKPKGFSNYYSMSVETQKTYKDSFLGREFQVIAVDGAGVLISDMPDSPTSGQANSALVNIDQIEIKSWENLF